MDMETSPASTSSNTTMPSMNTTMPDMNHTAMMRRVMAINMTVNMTDEMGKEIFIQDMKIYKDLGADIEIRRMYQNHLCLLTLLKLDIFFFVGYAIQLITLMPGGGSNSIIEFTIAIPISVLMLVFGFRGVSIIGVGMSLF
ncbi:hypothetical protein BC936DRAFT_148632 [Jimgerdemannia flammicorona]|uniref:Uncharacterized protein n=1 Tax=Jimgerdemannia flammicorona TaxID=994334 RepID=A0A433DKJ0_9FUNG|nr:hypothetical protein BC936DRAFT_148632 [Jimgerdemannia flammicorona]